ncbi:MAG TPA: SGNH/GDSL hydrolase family protein [bacterium]
MEIRIYLLFVVCILVFQSIGPNCLLSSPKFFPANHPYIQYSGRWDKSDPLHPQHSWPGVSVSAEFSGTSIGVRMADEHYYNVYIDGQFHRVFKGTRADEADYILADSLRDGHHSLLMTKRNCVQNQIYSFSGLLIDEGGELLSPAQQLSSRKIEFLGDSYTVAEGNEATARSMPWEETFPVTNIDQGFATIVARHCNAQYHITARSGIGMVTDWSGDHSLNLPDRFDRALMDAPEPRWDFKQWVPDLVVICLGLNDHSGLKDKAGNVSPENSALYRTAYRDFLATIRDVYPGVKILAVAAHVDWIRENIRQVVDEERATGKQDIYYAQFDSLENGFVANGHPSVEMHRKIAEQLLERIEAMRLFAKDEKSH